VQHALRAFTPRDQKAVKAVASTMRPNPKLEVEQVITELAVGEALVSFLDANGTPNVTERAWIAPPGSRIGPLSPPERAALVKASVVAGVYEQTIDRESAFELLKRRAEGAPAPAGSSTGAAGSARNASSAPAPAESSSWGGLGELLFGRTGPRGGHQPGVVDALAKSAARSVGSVVAREITRGIFGSLLGDKKRRR